MYFSRHTGEEISLLEHLSQSVVDILTTPIGSRVGRRDYGSRLFDLVDRPSSDTLAIDIAAESAAALSKWEPRIAIRRILSRRADAGGRFEIDVEAEADGDIFVIGGVTI